MLPQISTDSPAADFVPCARRGVNLATFLRQTASRIVDALAVVDPTHGISWTWSELATRAAHTAAELVSAGVRRRDTVMLLSANHAEMIQAFWGIMQAGGVVAPPNAKLTPEEVVALAQNTRPVAIVAHIDQRPSVEAVQAAGYAPTVFWIGAESGVSGAVADHTGGPAVVPAVVAEDDPCWYFFTSGSTGTPKAAVLTHGQLGIVLMNHVCDLFPNETPDGASLVIAPLSHGAGIHMLAQVFTGCASVLFGGGRFSGEEAWSLIDRYHVTNAFTVPTILNRIVAAYPEDRGPGDHSLRYVVYAGAPMMAIDQARALERLGPCLVQYFGLGEVTGAITALRPAEHGTIPVDEAGIGTCGRPRTAVQIAICDESGAEVPAGSPGEVCVAGPTVCAGYLNNDSANAEAFADGWFHTGDIGYVNPQGYLFLTGRKSDMYISGGSNVYPREIEELLLTHPSVGQVAVLGVPDAEWGEVGIAVVESDGTVTADDLKGFLAGRLARYKVPKEIRFVNEMPVTAYGKVARKELKAELVGTLEGR